MGKSVGKHAMMDYFPDMFTQVSPLSEDEHVNTHITDALSFIYSNFIERKGAGPNKPTTGADFFNGFRNLAREPFFQDPNVHTHIVILDKSSFTHCTKNVPLPPQCVSETLREQTLRKEGEMLLDQYSDFCRYGVDAAGECRVRPFISANSPLPTPWKAVMESRDKLRRWVVADALTALLDGKSEHRIRQKTVGDLLGKKIIFDGHCLEWADLAHMQGFMGVLAPDGEVYEVKSFEKWPEYASCTVYNTPIVLEYDLKGNRGFYFDPSRSNTLGEADFAIFHHIQRERPESSLSHVQINSTDVDLCYLSMIYWAKRSCEGARVPLLLHMGFVKSAPFQNDRKPLPLLEQDESSAAEGEKKKTPYYVVIERLVRSVCGFFEKPGEMADEESPADTLNNVLTYVCAMISAGSDYTEPYEYVTHSSFFKAISERAQYIQELVRAVDDGMYGIRLCSSAYVRLIKAAFCYSRMNRVPFKDFHFTNMDTKHIRNLVAKTNSNNPERNFPGTDEIVFRAGNVYYYMIMMYQVGESNLVLPENTELVYFGYGSSLDVSTMKPQGGDIMRGNIRRLCNDKTIVSKIEKND